MYKPQTVNSISDARRVRTLATSLAALLVGASLYAHNVRAEGVAPQATVDVTAGAFAPRS
jgi:hypothetical protein